MKHVEIGFNCLPNPNTTIHFSPTMDTLILESNEITSLQVLDYLDAPGYCPSRHILRSLQNVSLTNNSLNESPPKRPHNLSVLNLSETRISSWNCLSHLSTLLPQLTILRVTTETFSKTRTLLLSPL